MKQNSLNVILCLLLLQPSLHANPFQTGAARIAAVIYWAFIGMPAVLAAGYASQRPMVRDDIAKLDENGIAIFPELKDYDPIKYAKVKALLLDAGLSNIDDYSIKVITDEGIKKSPAWNGSHYSPFSLGNKVIAFPDNTPADESAKSECLLSNLDSPTVAALLGHEMQHDIENHVIKNDILRSITPFALHALIQTATTAHNGSPTIGRSLLRIAQGYAIVIASELIAHYWYSRQCERAADAALKNSPLLCRADAAYLGKSEYERKLEAECAEQWDKVHHDNQNIGTISTFFAKMMSKSQYVEIQKKNSILTGAHPWPSERMAYLEKWAAEQSK